MIVIGRLHMMLRNALLVQRGRSSDPDAELQQKLSEGWEIRPPVYTVRRRYRRWRVEYHVVLWRDGQPTVLTLHDSIALRRLIHDQRLDQQSL